MKKITKLVKIKEVIILIRDFFIPKFESSDLLFQTDRKLDKPDHQKHTVLEVNQYYKTYTKVYSILNKQLHCFIIFRFQKLHFQKRFPYLSMRASKSSTIIPK